MARKAAAAIAGAVTTTLPKAPKKFSMPASARPSALIDPQYDLAAFRPPYRDASPGLYGGNVFFGWPGLHSADREIVRYRGRAVANARDADRNQPFINAGITKRAANAVGANLRLQYLPNWEMLGVDPDSEEAVQFVQDVENHFSLWGEDFRFLCDAQRQGQFGANMLLACRECFGTEGETLVIVRYDEDRMVSYRGEYATFIEVVSVDRLSNPMNYSYPGPPLILKGKELDQYGAAVAFHVETTHPDDSTTGERTWQRIVRETEWGRPVGVHFFPRHRAGQQRAMPAIIASLRGIKMLDRFDDAQLQAAVINAILSVYVQSEGTTADILQKLTTGTPAGSNNLLAELWDKRFGYYEENALEADGVRIPVLPPGDKVEMSSVNRAEADTGDFRSAFLRSFAAQLNLTYEQFSGDYSETTFSSARAALIDIWRLITVDRILFTQHVAYPIFAAFLEELWVRADEIGLKWPAAWPDFHENMTAYSQCEFRGPGMGWVDPQKDVTAAGLRVQQGLTSPTYEAAMQGQDFRDNVDQIARDRRYAERKGVPMPGTAAFAAASQPPAPDNGGGGNDGSSSDSSGGDGQPPADQGAAQSLELEKQENRR